MTSTAEQPARSPGRPRSERAHRAILDAALELFVEQGYEAMSIEGVATRAGVGKTTIYRRWQSKEDLVIDAIDELIMDVEPVETGSLRQDLVDLLTQLQVVLTSSRAGEVFPRMIPHVAGGSPLGKAYLRRVIEPRFAMLRTTLGHAVERGEFPADADPELVRGLLVGPLLMWKLIGLLSGKGALPQAERLVDAALEGLRARSGS